MMAFHRSRELSRLAARRAAVVLAAGLLAMACSPDSTVPTQPLMPAYGWGPETPQFNLELVLRGDGFGLVKFRQPNDGNFTVFLDVWVRDLAPNTAYVLQRAVDEQLDGECTGSAWLSLGHGLTPFAVVTDANGTGRADLFRNVPPLAGTSFDIQFRLIEEGTGTVALQSGCYEYTISI